MVTSVHTPFDLSAALCKQDLDEELKKKKKKFLSLGHMALLRCSADVISMYIPMIFRQDFYIKINTMGGRGGMTGLISDFSN